MQMEPVCPPARDAQSKPSSSDRPPRASLRRHSWSHEQDFPDGALGLRSWKDTSRPISRRGLQAIDGGTDTRAPSLHSPGHRGIGLARHPKRGRC